jgi:hypothetical protein
MEPAGAGSRPVRSDRERAGGIELHRGTTTICDAQEPSNRLHRLPIVYSVPLGGPVLFGTDVGFTTVYDTSLEYELMHRALSESQVLASLTTNSAAYFKAAKKGKVENGI